MNSYLYQVRQAVSELDSGLEMVTCGSYRRGKSTCGDVDVLVTHPDGKSHVGVFSKLLNKLHDQGNYLPITTASTKLKHRSILFDDSGFRSNRLVCTTPNLGVVLTH